jgi:hypothetical protein
MVNRRDIAALIESVVREHFAGSTIDAVDVREDQDDEGQPAFHITVVFDAPGLLDPRKTVSIARQVRQALLAQDEAGFPMFTFVSRRDARGLKVSAA